MMSDVPLYRTCVTCGRLMPLQAESKQVYCSPECARENQKCPVCGRFFEKGTGVPAEGDTEVCGESCSRTDHRYDFLFKELP